MDLLQAELTARCGKDHWKAQETVAGWVQSSNKVQKLLTEPQTEACWVQS
mgnify:CR=1 FL=1